MEEELYLSGMGIPEVSEKTGIPLSTIRFRLFKKNLLRSPTEATRLARKRGRFPSKKGIKRGPMTEATRKKMSIAKTGVGKGTTISAKGYVRYTMGGLRDRMVHTVTMEKHIGRRIFKDECVHHIDHNKQNNQLENLQLMSLSDHARLHALLNHHKRIRNKQGRYV